jgi:hypothetical protein
MASRGRGLAEDKAWLIAPKKIVRGFRAERARVLTHVVGMLVVSGVDGLVLPEAG